MDRKETFWTMLGYSVRWYVKAQNQDTYERQTHISLGDISRGEVVA